MPKYEECELQTMLVCSLAKETPATKTEQMAIEASFTNYLIDCHGIMSNRDAIREIQFSELVALSRAWARAVAAGRCVV